MDITVVISSFVLLFLAEIGDKTQLMAMTLAHRYRVAPVIVGVFMAFVVLNLIAVWVGEALFRYVPQSLVLLVAGGLFLLFAYRIWRESAVADEEEESPRVGGYGALLTSFVLIFLAELGDKTQLALIALVGGTGKIWSVFVGGTLALWAVSLIAVMLGGTVLRRVPKVWMHRAAATLFLAFGVLAIGRVLLGTAAGEELLAAKNPPLEIAKQNVVSADTSTYGLCSGSVIPCRPPTKGSDTHA